MGKYDDIISLPHHVSKTHPQMPLSERAAQFSSFAALSGYEDAVAESGRLTGERVELDRDAIEELNAALSFIKERLGEQPEITVSYFVPDPRKSGGSYTVRRGRVKKIDELASMLVFSDGGSVSIGDIYSIDLPEDASPAELG